MEQKFSDTYRTSFLTLDRYLQQSNSAQFYFRPLLPPLNTVSGEFYSLSPAQGTDPSIRINKYSSNGTFLGFGYLYDTSFNVPPDTSGGGGDVSGGYWTLTGSNIYNNNPGFVGIGTTAPAAALDVSGGARIRGPALSNLLFVGDASLNNPVAEQDTVKIGTAGVGGRLAIGDDGKGVLRLLNAFGDSYIETGTNMAVGSSGRLIFSSMFDLSGGPTMTVNTGTDEVVISNRFIDPPVAGYKLTVDGSANMLGNMDVSGIVYIHGPALSNLLFVGDASLNNPVAEQDTVKIGTAGVGGRLAIGDDGQGVLRLLNAFGDSYIETGTNMAVGSTGRLIFSSMFDLSGGPTMTVNTGTDEVVISNRFIDPPVAGYKLTVDGSANVLGNVDVSGIVHIQNGGKKALLVGDTIDPLWDGNSVQIIDNTTGIASMILGTDTSGALRFMATGSKTYIQAGKNISGGSGTQLLFTQFNNGTASMIVDTSEQYVSVGRTPISTFNGNQFNVDGSASITSNIKSGHHYPQASYTYDLGSSSAYWRDLYLSTGTIYMGPSSQIRSSNPLILDLSGTGGLYVTSGATVGRVYDTAFNPAPALAPQTILTVVDHQAITVTEFAQQYTFASPIPASGNYIVKLEWQFGTGTDMKNQNIYSTITTITPAYSIVVSPITTPSYSVFTTYTTFGTFQAGDTPVLNIDTRDLYAASAILSTTQVTVSILYLSS
jgi:hypothetical protein